MNRLLEELTASFAFIVVVSMAAPGCTQQPAKAACSQASLEALTVLCEETIKGTQTQAEKDIVQAACLRAIDKWEACE